MPTTSSRLAGILIPLFSMPSAKSWGIGEITDIPRMAEWLDSAGLRLLQLLPINEMPPAETSPYSPLSAMAIDPQFISVGQMEDFAAIADRLGDDFRVRLEAARNSPTIDYRVVRRLKESALRLSFERFRDTEWASGTRRAAALRAYVRDQTWWLDDYALFRALHAAQGERPWGEWPAPLRDRAPDALANALVELADDVLYRQYLQWIADDQWADARRDLGNVALFGDLPFMVSGDSADVWARQDEFRLDASIGVPPDAFSETGQNWEMPVYRWEVLAERGFDWLRDRARRNSALFDGYRVDHLVGFYRTYFRPHDGGPAQFSPPDDPAQVQLGERVLEVFRSSGAHITAEDLGIVPQFVRDSLARQGIAGYKVLRWERYWHEEGQPFKDPCDYPVVGVATSGTHDTEPMAMWWENASRPERQAVLAIPSLGKRLTDEDRAVALGAPAMSHSLREALLETLYASGSDLLIFPVQDVFGWYGRINQPATVNASNWAWRLPWPVDRLPYEPTAMAVAAQLREWGGRHNR
jgi:4-alpha-glucanotransferase